MRIVVCGASGYIGRKLVQYLVDAGHRDILAVTRRPHSGFDAVVQQDIGSDLMNPPCCERVVRGAEWVFNLAASVGGIGFVSGNTASALENVLINTNLIRAAAEAKVNQYFFASSSCVYPPGIERPLRESDCMPANPMGGYGWEKMYSEAVCKAFSQERNLPTCIARYHGIYGPGDVRAAGRDHVATALAKKVIHAKRSGVHEIPIWGDGEQTRSFLYVDDCVEGTYRLMQRGVPGPVNLAHPVPASVNQMVDALEEIAGIKLMRFYQPNAPVGRQHKVSDNTLLRKALNWEPETALIDGLRKLYNELWDQSLK